MKTTKIILLLFLCFSLKAIAEKPYWELVSMTPPKGHVWNFVYNKYNDVFASSNQGIFKSTDSGESWRLVLSGSPLNPVVICENGYIFALRLSLNIEDWLKYKLVRSTDNGETWTEFERFWEKLKIKKPETPELVTLSVDKNKLLLMMDYPWSNTYYFMSTDFGNTWQMSRELVRDTSIYYTPYDLIILNDSTIYHIFEAQYQCYLFKSNDNGKNFEILKIPFNSGTLVKFVKFKTNELYLLTGKGIYYSNDEGKNWELKYLPKIGILDFIKKNDTLIATGGKSCYYSFNDGKDWQTSSIDVVTSLVPDLTADFSLKYMRNAKICWTLGIDNYGKLYSSPGQNGIYLSDDAGETWYKSNKNFSSTHPFDFIFKKNGEAILTCRGVFKTDKNLENWELLGLNSIYLGQIAINSKGKLFTGDFFTDYNNSYGFLRSDENGNNWEKIRSGLLYNGLLCSRNDIIMSTSGGGGAGHSSDDGQTWSVTPQTQEQIGTNDEGHLFTFRWPIFFDPGIQYCARSTNNGMTWDPLQFKYLGYEDDKAPDGRRIVFNNKTKSAWYGPIRNMSSGDENFEGIIRTTDNGRTWFTDNVMGRPEYKYEWWPKGNEVAVDSLGCWIAKRNGYGIYRSCDNAMTWELMDTSGLLSLWFGPIAVSPNGYIHVFGYNGGLYRSRDRYVSVEENMKTDYNPNELLSSDIYEIEVREWELYGRDNTIKIYNTLGECVIKDSFDSETMYYGGKKQVNISFLNPGVYFICYGKVKKSFVKVE